MEDFIISGFKFITVVKNSRGIFRKHLTLWLLCYAYSDSTKLNNHCQSHTGNVNEVIRSVLNSLLFLRIDVARTKSTKSTKTQPSKTTKSTETQISE